MCWFSHRTRFCCYPLVVFSFTVKYAMDASFQEQTVRIRMSIHYIHSFVDYHSHSTLSFRALHGWALGWSDLMRHTCDLVVAFTIEFLDKNTLKFRSHCLIVSTATMPTDINTSTLLSCLSVVKVGMVVGNIKNRFASDLFVSEFFNTTAVCRCHFRYRGKDCCLSYLPHECSFQATVQPNCY